ncbi:MAG TPA: sulfite exporter TauE/SafE family protein [Leptospiraceae bacterium]|nr:sulfite exporter TauE/SafE family protein [Leptospiraceae bacterium]
MTWILLPLVGIASGIVAGILGVGGGTILVPAMVFLGIEAHSAIGTSTLAMIFTSLSGTIRNDAKGGLQVAAVIQIGIASLLGAQGGAFLTTLLKTRTLEILFAILLIFITISGLRKTNIEKRSPTKWLVAGRALTGLTGGFLSGLFGIGGGIVMVPLQILLLGEDLITAVKTSLGVIVITALGATIAHAMHGQVLVLEGITLGAGGVIGAQIGTRMLPALPQNIVKIIFAILATILASALIFWGK